ncbi:hypothetical protein MAR_017157 [Mya arenaria]|uniref:DZANK-type domain-containing protein n=1 Tax=Mya arenaria TaxID=6604 RepID=A0ABY7EDG4_MYAAR|nr:hypothetical protein MAR_017157 [Mya arenaria]
MKKCSNPECGLEGEERFCYQCGCKMIDPPTIPLLSSIVIICDGEDESGSLCGAELKTIQKFCSKCGKKVDTNLLEVQTPNIEKCGRCGTALSPGEHFCPECGFKEQPMAKQGADAQQSQENQAIVADKSEPVSMTTTNVSKSENDVQHYHPAPCQTPTYQPQQAEEPDFNMEVQESATEVKHLRVEGPDHEQKIKAQTGERDKQQEPDTKTLSAGDAQQGEASTLKPIEEHTKPRELTEEEETQTNKPVAVETQSQDQVNLVSVETTECIEEDTMDTSNLAGDNNLRVFNLDYGNNERKQEILMQKDHDSNIDEDSSKAIINSCVSPDAIKERQSEQQTIFEQNSSAGQKQAGNETVENELEKSINDSSIAHDETMNDDETMNVPSNGETFHNEFSEDDDYDSEDNSADSDSSELVLKIENTKKPKQRVHGGKRSIQSHNRGSKVRRAKKRARKKGKSNVPSNTNEENEVKNDRPTTHSAATKSISQAAEVAGESLQRTTVCPDKHDNSKPEKERIFGQGVHQVKLSTNIDTFEEEDDLPRRRSLDHQNYFEYEYKLDFDRKQLGGKTTFYKYCVIRDGKYKWEGYVDGSLISPNRKLHVENGMFDKKDKWHQYDGMVIPKVNLFKRGYEYLKGKFPMEAAQRAEHFALTFVPYWFQEGFILEDIKESYQVSLEHLEMLMNGIVKVYQYDVGCWNSPQDCKNRVCFVLFQPLIEQISSEEHGSKTSRFVRALAIIIACNKLGVDVPLIVWQTLCRSVLVTADPLKKKCTELDAIAGFFEPGEVKQAIVMLVKKVFMYGKDPSWMFCLPLLHFVCNVCEPYEEMITDLTYAAPRPKWWGTANITDAVKTFQENTQKWNMPLDFMLQTLGPLFEMDYLLPRCIVASLAIHEIPSIIDNEEIPVEVCCATLLHWMKATNPYFTTFSYLAEENSSNEKTVTQCLEKLLMRLQNMKDSSGRKLISWEMSYCIAKELVYCAASKNRTQKLMHSLHIFLQCISSYSKLEAEGSANKNDRMDAIETVVNKLSVFSSRKNEFIHLYCAEVENFNTTMKGCLTNIAMKAIDGGYTIEYWRLGLTEKERFRDLLSDLFQRQWQTVVTNGPQDAEYMRIIKMAISWEPIQLFVRNQTEDTGISLLIDECKENLQIAMTMLESHWETLETGKIDIGILQMISDHSEGFSDILALIRPNESGLKDKVLSTIKIRMNELEAFKNQSRQMTVFVSHCQHLESVDTRAIDEVLQKTYKLEKHSLMEFCKPKVVEDSDGTSDPDLRAFDVEPAVLDILPKFERLAEGFVFIKIWIETCLGTTERCKTPLDVVNVVWKPVFKRFVEPWYNV